MDPHGKYTQLDSLFEEMRLKKLYQSTEEAFKASEPVGHNWEHIRRVIINASEIGFQEGADMEIVVPAVILHDIGYITHPHDPKKHPLNGSRECLSYLEEWTPEQREKISGCILKHKGKFPGFDHSEPTSLEEMVVCDADQLEKFGWTGLIQMVRVFVELGEKGFDRFKSFEGMTDGIADHRNIAFYTETGRRLAAQLDEPDFQELSSKLKRELTTYTNWKGPV